MNIKQQFKEGLITNNPVLVQLIGMCATKISAGSKVGVGGHDEEAKGDEQFEISDPRGVAEVEQMLYAKGMQPVYRDYIRMEQA